MAPNGTRKIAAGRNRKIRFLRGTSVSRRSLNSFIDSVDLGQGRGPRLPAVLGLGFGGGPFGLGARVWGGAACPTAGAALRGRVFGFHRLGGLVWVVLSCV